MANNLYNGVELPALPEFDAELPCLTLVYSTQSETETTARLIASNKQFSWETDIYKVNEATVQQAYHTVGTDEGWRMYSLSDNFSGGFFLDPLWANYDIILKDGSILAASDPVPVTTAATLLMGYRVGQLIRELRERKNK